MNPPSLIGPYETIRLLGEGGMGAVYLARDPAIGRLVAIKLLREGTDTPLLRARFGQEARAAGSLHHPNIVTIHHVDEDQGRPYIVMEYVEGKSLATLIEERAPIGVVRKLQLLARICAGLQSAHDSGLVHRDVKPANVIVDASMEPKLLDFGVAKLPDSPLSLTDPHAIVGTLCYMSPEQLSNRAIDHRSDLFSVAALGYELLTLQRAFTGDASHVIAQVLAGTPAVSLDESDLDAGIRRVIARGLRAEPEHRYQSARDMGAAFTELANRLGEPSSVSSRSAAVVPMPTKTVATMPHPVSFRVPLPESPKHRLVAVAIAVVATVSLFAFLYSRALPVGTQLGFAPERTVATPEDTPAPRSSAAPPAAAATVFPGIRAGTDQPRILGSSTSEAKPRTNPQALNALPSAASGRAEVTEPIGQPETVTAPMPPIVPVGSLLLVSVMTALDSRRNGTGDEFSGLLEEAVHGDGRELIAAGTRVEGRVEQSGVIGGRPFMEMSVTGVGIGSKLVPVRTGFYRAIAPLPSSGSPNFTSILIGATVGAVIGGALGGGKGAAAGGVIGAASGSSVRTEQGGEYRLAAGLPFRLAEAVRIE